MKRISTRGQRAIARRLTEVAFAVPQVVAHRACRMASDRPSASDRRELNRMVSEKAAAFSEAWLAMSMQAMRVNLAWSTGFLRSPLAPMSASRANAAMLSVFGAGLAPVHRRAVANAKRLARAR
ncbi:MAG: hypothetical protein ABIR98_04015 [Usitatibacter sp.]